jgi:hypothetical protein
LPRETTGMENVLRRESRLGVRGGQLISAPCGSQALGQTLRVPSPGSLTSPLPLGSVRAEIVLGELDALALLLVHERRTAAPSNAVR